MCTLTFYPVSSEEFIITSNRDESTNRSGATLPQYIDLKGKQKLLMPVDGEAGGSWIACTPEKRVAVLLNGAFEAHKHDPPYLKSRGIVLKESFLVPVDNFLSEYPLEGIEPFTLVIFELGDNPIIHQLVWDGTKKHILNPDPNRPNIWSAAMLYPKPVRESSERLFDQFLEHNINPGRNGLLDFNLSEVYTQKVKRHGIEPYPELKTLSISSISLHKRGLTYLYRDLLNPVESITGIR